MNVAKGKLENLCRELQKHSKAVAVSQCSSKLGRGWRGGEGCPMVPWAINVIHGCTQFVMPCVRVCIHECPGDFHDHSYRKIINYF